MEYSNEEQEELKSLGRDLEKILKKRELKENSGMDTSQENNEMLAKVLETLTLIKETPETAEFNNRVSAETSDTISRVNNLHFCNQRADEAIKVLLSSLQTFKETVADKADRDTIVFNGTVFCRYVSALNDNLFEVLDFSGIDTEDHDGMTDMSYLDGFDFSDDRYYYNLSSYISFYEQEINRYKNCMDKDDFQSAWIAANNIGTLSCPTVLFSFIYGQDDRV